MSTLTDTKIINLLERLSVVAPERCHLREGYSWEKESQRPNPPLMEWMLLVTYRSCPAIKEYRQTPENGWRVYPEFILMAVLEEAHAQGWEWEKSSSAWELGKGLKVFAMVREDKGDVLEREVLPRFECLVLALETKGRAM